MSLYDYWVEKTAFVGEGIEEGTEEDMGATGALSQPNVAGAGGLGALLGGGLGQAALKGLGGKSRALGALAGALGGGAIGAGASGIGNLDEVLSRNTGDDQNYRLLNELRDAMKEQRTQQILEELQSRGGQTDSLINELYNRGVFGQGEQ